MSGDTWPLFNATPVRPVYTMHATPTPATYEVDPACGTALRATSPVCIARNTHIGIVCNRRATPATMQRAGQLRTGHNSHERLRGACLPVYLEPPTRKLRGARAATPPR